MHWLNGKKNMTVTSQRGEKIEKFTSWLQEILQSVILKYYEVHQLVMVKKCKIHQRNIEKITVIQLFQIIKK